ncbi:MAG: cytochrome c oxidase subunit 3 [Rickettsiaceae bacterium]|nr:cytochrome c oxidase subunit 3 [Rickettsiaceae bacterium]
MSHEKASHPYHIVDLSPWPILTAFSLLFATGGGLLYMHKYTLGHYILPLGIVFLASCMFFWWRDVLKEAKSSHHTTAVQRGLRIGMALFILSEVMFFFAFFWSFFKARLFPEGILDEAGIWIIENGVWPPRGIKLFDPWDIPFMNTLVLLLSGTTVTWAHYSITANDRKNAVKALGYTILLGVFFTSMQAYEYYHAAFKFTDGIYATNFYMATGFHGAHVIIGTIFLFVCYMRTRNGDFDKSSSHLGFEFAAWYWHFVDVIWLFLFIFLYVLG